MTAALANENNTSTRLLKMLETDPQWSTEKKGLCTDICNALNGEVSYATVHKWLYSNSLPRTPEERQFVAAKLGVDLIYWEYGVYSKSSEKPILKIDHVHYLKHTTMVLKTLSEKGIATGKDISEQALLKIQEMSVNHCAKNGLVDPDKQLIEDAIDIVLLVKNS